MRNGAERTTQTEAEGNGNLCEVEDESGREVDAFYIVTGRRRGWIVRMYVGYAFARVSLEQRAGGSTLWSTMHLRLLNTTYYGKM